MSRSLAKKLAAVKPGTLYAGVDMALKQNYTLILADRAQILDRFGFPNDRDGYNYFHRRLKALQSRRQAPAVLVGMEPTNYFWKLLATYLEQQQIAYRLINPYTVKKRREGDQLDRSKDDPRDAFVISDLLRTGKYTETRLLHGLYAELRQAVVLHDRLRGELRRCKTLLRNSAGQLFPELSQEFKRCDGLTARALFRNGAIASEIQALSPGQFIQQVRSQFRGQRLQLGKLRRVHQLAPTSIGLLSGCQTLQLTLRLQVEQLEALEDQVEQVDSALSDIFLALPEAPYMLSLPGLGLVTAATILGEVGNPQHYRRVNQWIKLAGTQPVPNTSGRKSRSQTPMSHKGRSRLRTTLFFATMRLVNSDDAFTQLYHYYQQRPKNPLTKMQALGVLMNKLLRVLWALIKQQTFYNPALVLPA